MKAIAVMIFFLSVSSALANTASLTGSWTQTSSNCDQPWYLTEEPSGLVSGTVESKCPDCQTYSLLGYRDGDELIVTLHGTGSDCYCNPYWDCGPLKLSADGNTLTGPCFLPMCGSVHQIVVERDAVLPAIRASPPGRDFGYHPPGGSATAQNFIIFNSAPAGSGTFLTISAVSLDGTDASEFLFLSNNCTNITLGPADSCVFDVGYLPEVAEVEKSQAWVSVHSNDPVAPILQITLQGGMPASRTQTPAATPNAEDTGDPIQTATGELFIGPVTDFSLGGPLPLELKRYYAVGLSEDPLINSRLKNWMHNFNMRLVGGDPSGQIKDQTFVYAVLFKGDVVSFAKVGDNWVQIEQKVKSFQLKQDADGDFWLFDPGSFLAYVFDGDIGALQKIADRNGNSLELTYDGYGYLSQVSDGLGRTLTFDANGKHLKGVTDGTRTVTYGFWNGVALVEASDVSGNLTTYENSHFGYENHRITSVVHPLGNHHYTQDYSWGAWDRVLVQTDAYGNSLTLEYDTPAEGITTLTDALGHQRRTTHAQQKVMVQREDETGKSAFFDYDQNGRRTGVTDRLGATTSITYHPPTGKIQSVTNALGHTISYSYTPLSLTYGGTVDFTTYFLTGAAYPDGTTQAFSHDAMGNILTHTDQAGEKTAYTYNTMGQVLTVTLPGGGQTVFTYNPDGTLASRTDTDTGAFLYTYDTLKRLIQVTAPDGATTSFTRDDNDRVTAVTDGNGNTIEFTYDANGNLIARTDPAGHIAQFTYDLMDRLTGYTDESGHTTQIAYDALGRVSSRTGPDNITRSYEYNSRGWLTQTGRGGHVLTQTHDDEGVLASVSSAMGKTLGFQANALGYPVKTTGALGATVSQTRDAMNRVTAVTDPLSHTTDFTYGPRGLAAGITLPDGRAAAYQRNGLGLLEQVSDLGGNPWSFEHTPMGRLKKRIDPLGNETQYGYDTLGRLSFITYADGNSLTLTYDNAGNPVKKLYSDGTELEFSYDALDRLASTDGLSLTRDETGRVTSTQSDQSTFGATYDDAGRLETVTYDNAMTVTYAYSPTTGLLNKVSDSLTNSWITFSYDADQQLTGMERSNGIDTQFSHDGAGRLTRIQAGGFMDIQYTLNASGQVVQADMDVPLDPAGLIQDTDRSFSHDGAGHITSAGYNYDARGRRTEAPGTVYTWDNASRLTGVGDVSLAYNGMGNLIKRTQSGGTIQMKRSQSGSTIQYHYNYALGRISVVAEKEDTTGQVIRFYVRTPLGDLLYAVDAQAANAVSFYHFDRTGSTLALSDTSGDVTDAYAYSVTGEQLGHTGSASQPFTFAGKQGARQEDDQGTLYYIDGRYYDAVTASSLSRDSNPADIPELRDVNPFRSPPNDLFEPVALQPRIYTGHGIIWDAEKESGIPEVIFPPVTDGQDDLGTKYLGDEQGWWKTARNAVTDDHISGQDAGELWADSDIAGISFVGKQETPKKHTAFITERGYEIPKSPSEKMVTKNEERHPYEDDAVRMLMDSSTIKDTGLYIDHAWGHAYGDHR